MQSLLSDAWKVLLKNDLSIVAKNSLSEKIGNKLILKFTNKNYVVDCEEKKILFNNLEEKNFIIAILILHYLTNAKDIELENRLISFRELYGGDIYYKVFYERAIQPLEKLTKEEFYTACKKLSALELYLGDSSFEISVFPRVSLTLIYWQGDEEIPTKANILFDANANRHLHTEDLSKIGMIISKEIVRGKH